MTCKYINTCEYLVTPQKFKECCSKNGVEDPRSCHVLTIADPLTFISSKMPREYLNESDEDEYENS